MGSLLIRNVPERTLDALKARAREHERSLQAEVLDLLEQAALPMGDAMLAWLEQSADRDLPAEPGLRALRESRDSR